MSDLERLRAELRQANAELEVRAPDWDAALDHAHHRLRRRILVVAILSGLGATLLLTGGLAAPAAIHQIRHGDSTESASVERRAGDGEADRSGGSAGKGNPDKGTNGGNGGKSGSGSDDDKKHKEPDRSERAVGGGTEAPAELADLVVVEVTQTKVVVENRSEVSSAPFYVLITATRADGKEVFKRVGFTELAANANESEPIEANLSCASGEIQAIADYGKEVEERADANNTAYSEPIEPPAECETSGGPSDEPPTTSSEKAEAG